MRPLESFAAPGQSQEIQSMKYQHYEQKRLAKLGMVSKFIQDLYFNYGSQLALTTEERIVKTANSNQKSRERASHVNRVRSGTNGFQNELNMSSSMLLDNLNYSYQVDKTERNKRRWMRIYENKEKLTIDQQLYVKQKIDKQTKLEKMKKKKQDEIKEEFKGLQEFKSNKFSSVLKRRELIDQDLQKKLQQREESLNKKMQVTLENKKKYEQDFLNSKYYGTSNSKFLTSELEMSQGRLPRADRAKSAYDKARKFSNHGSDSLYYEDQEDDQKVQRSLYELEMRIQKAESQKYNQISKNIEKWHSHNEQIVQKQNLKSQMTQQTDYERLKDLIDKNQSFMKKSKKRVEEIRDHRDLKLESIHQKEETKRARLDEIKKQLDSKIQSLESKFKKKDQMAQNIRQAMDEFSHQKRELKSIKKQEQEQNLRKQRRVQSAYKRILIDRLKEKEERAKQLIEKKQKILEYKQKNVINLRNTMFQSISNVQQTHQQQKADEKNNDLDMNEQQNQN
ncbi:UNKNOWN [Stylonychia lemnae]|uniref:Uncharacterized protein n=1 Tax=Stylonychia lemnae TaxID=5949 RepID=A0A078B0P9_STYLE|nr:UNKNOWN [Stylonychia lemnae]|eukprot:CDW88235.1 UNKNOWN [Stylonychia lemnae]